MLLVLLITHMTAQTTALPTNINLDDYDYESNGLDVPKDALNRPQSSHERLILHNMDVGRSNECYCSYGVEEGVCSQEGLCLKHPNAACYHAIKEKYDEESQRMETLHIYGCATLEKGSKASHLTCNSWRFAHEEPFSIACCYEGNFCNLNITPPAYTGIYEHEYDPEGPITHLNVHIPLLSCFFLSVIVVLGLLFFFWKRRSEKALKHSIEEVEEKQNMLDYSCGTGSGSGQMTLNQRTIAQDLKVLQVIGRGRYGQVRKALYRGSYVAVKTFSTTDEESWKNERDIYYTEMFNHENILQFVAADICSEDSITQMLLVTDYHENGSLYDYLQRVESLSLEEALSLAHSESKILPEHPKVQVGTKRYMAPEVLSRTLNSNNFSAFLMADIYAFALVLWEIASRIMTDGGEAHWTQGRNGESSESGLGESLSSPQQYIHQSFPSDSSTRAQPYTPPFEGLVASDPSFQEMQKIVCEQKIRPPVQPEWLNGKNKSVTRLVTLMTDCWNDRPDCRHTALRCKIELKKILEDYKSQVNRIVKPSDSGVRLTMECDEKFTNTKNGN